MFILKKISFISIAFLIGVVIVSCKKDIKKEAPKFSLEQNDVTVKWTGYKTTDKIAVNGQFREINITNINEGENALETLNGAEFSIPVSSLFTDEPVRDSKLKQLFFGVMDNTLSLNGKLNLLDNGSGTIDLLMNGIQQKISVTYTISGELVELQGIMNLDNWNGNAALASLTEACFELHKGPDGISKTWNEVAVRATVNLKKN